MNDYEIIALDDINGHTTYRLWQANTRTFIGPEYQTRQQALRALERLEPEHPDLD